MSEKKELSLLHGFMDFVYQPQLIKEFKDSNNGKVMMKGILQRADTVNQNGRIYPRDILAREVRNYQKLIRENRSLGELDHPDTSVVELKNVSHIVKSAEMDQDGVVHGEVEILNTPAGKPAASTHSANRILDIGAISDGFSTIVHPAANAAPTFSTT